MTRTTAAELTRRYVDLDPEMGPTDIAAKIKKDHGRDIDRQTIAQARWKYLKSRGPTKFIIKDGWRLSVPVNGATPIHANGTTVTAPDPCRVVAELMTPPDIAGMLVTFLDAVKTVGGPDAARRILDMLNT